MQIIDATRQSSFPKGFAPGREEVPTQLMGGILSLANDTGTKHTGATNHDSVAETFDFSVAANRSLSVWFSQDNGGTYKKVVIGSIVGATPAATTAAEVVAILAANTVFNRFIAATAASSKVRLNARMPSSRFKMYFGGTAAAVLAGVFTTAIATGSAVTGANVAGSTKEFQVTDQKGNPIADYPVFVTGRITTVGGTASATTAFGLISKGEYVTTLTGGYQDVEMRTDLEGKVAFYIAESASQVTQVVVRPGHASAALAVLAQGAAQITFS